MRAKQFAQVMSCANANTDDPLKYEACLRKQGISVRSPFTEEDQKEPLENLPESSQFWL